MYIGIEAWCSAFCFLADRANAIALFDCFLYLPEVVIPGRAFITFEP